LEFAQKAQAEMAGERTASPKQEFNRHSNMLRANPTDPLNVALSVRGMARNLSEMLETTNPKKIADEIHERIKDAMGSGWQRENTMDVLNGYGAFTQSTEGGLMNAVKGHQERIDNFNKEINAAMKRGTARERKLAIEKANKKFNVEVHNFETQLSSHIEDVKNDLAKAIGELKNHEESCI
jgi:hypothetical protein